MHLVHKYTRTKITLFFKLYTDLRFVHKNKKNTLHGAVSSGVKPNKGKTKQKILSRLKTPPKKRQKYNRNKIEEKILPCAVTSGTKFNKTNVELCSAGLNRTDSVNSVWSRKRIAWSYEHKARRRRLNYAYATRYIAILPFEISTQCS